MELFGNISRRRKLRNLKTKKTNADVCRHKNEEKTRIHRKIRTPIAFDWFLLVGFTASLRLIWRSITITDYMNGFPLYEIDFPHRETMSTSRRISRRKRPPRHSDATFISEILPARNFQNHTSTVLSTPLSLNIPEDDSNLCGDIDSESRILISGILTHPLASEFALYVANNCGNPRITGYADYSLDSDGYFGLSYLLEQLPQIEIVHTAPSDSSHSSQDFPRIFSSLEPTHVIHMEPTTFLSQHMKIKPTYIAVRNSLNKLERLCESIVKQEAMGMHKVKFIYVTAERSKDEVISRVTKEIYPMIMKTYMELYKINILQLKLPTIYGPFSQSEFVVDRFLGKNTTMSENEPLIHIKDCLYILLDCMQIVASKFSPSTVPTIVVPESHTKTFGYLSTLIAEDKILDLSKISKEERLLITNQIHILSWYASRFRRYGSPSGEKKEFFRKTKEITSNHLRQNKSIEISQLQRRQYNLFPCSSECGSPETCRQTSAFDSAIIEMTHNITTGCKYLVYLMDFSIELENLPHMEENTREEKPWPIEQLCQVAFVSSRSTLVSRLIKEEQGNSTFWNGKLKDGRWKIVWPNNDADQNLLEEAEYVMPKIAPGSFFSTDVIKAIYLEPQHLVHLPPLPILWYLMSTQMDKTGRKDRGIPSKHISFFTHIFGLSKSDIEFSTADALAQFVLQQKDHDWNEYHWPTRQTSFYNYVLHEPNYPMDFEITDTYLIVHDLQSDRSRRLRCEWYEEQLVWSNHKKSQNRNLEDLSLSYVMAKWRKENRLVVEDESWGERLFTMEDMLTSHRYRQTASRYFIRLHKRMKSRRRYNNMS